MSTSAKMISSSPSNDDVKLPLEGTHQVGLTDSSQTMSTSAKMISSPSNDDVKLPLEGTHQVGLPLLGSLSQSTRGLNQRNRKKSHSCSNSKEVVQTTKTNEETLSSKKRKVIKKVMEDVLTPEQRAIPDTPLLRNLGEHPSVRARLGLSAFTQNLNFRGAWPTALGLCRQAHDVYKELFISAGFGDFLKIDAVHIPQAYLVALMERWFSETNTLHLPCCEIGPTPLDWTMITGLRFKGQKIRLDHKYEMNQALSQLGVGTGAITEGKIRLSSITPNMEEVKMAPENDEAKAMMFRRLFLYVLGSCFFSNNRSVINHELVQFMERIDEVGCYDWGSITYAAFLAGMRRKVTGEIGAFTGFWPFLLFWAFEYLKILRPSNAIEDVFPRAVYWSSSRILASANFSDVIAARCQLDFTDETQITWQPYLGSAQFNSPDLVNALSLSRRRVPFESVDTWEYYLGERCSRQLGFACQVPHSPPRKMHGGHGENPEDEIGIGRLADSFLLDVNVDYASWFAAHSIGRIVDISPLLGGVAIGGKVLEHWLANHCPNMMLIPRLEYEAMTEARDAAIAECQMLRDELVIIDHPKHFNRTVNHINNVIR